MAKPSRGFGKHETQNDSGLFTGQTPQKAHRLLFRHLFQEFSGSVRGHGLKSGHQVSIVFPFDAFFFFQGIQNLVLQGLEFLQPRFHFLLDTIQLLLLGGRGSLPV